MLYQVLVSVPKLRDFCIEPDISPQLKKGPIGAAVQELIQNVYGALFAKVSLCPSRQWLRITEAYASHEYL